MVMVDEAFSIGHDEFVFIHHDGRFVIYDPVLFTLAVDGSFTRKKLVNYIKDDLDLESGDGEIVNWERYIDKAESQGWFGSLENTIDEVISGNKCGKGGVELRKTQFITQLMQRSPQMKDLYRCELCSEVVIVAVDEEGFSGANGERPVSTYCINCSDIA